MDIKIMIFETKICLRIYKIYMTVIINRKKIPAEDAKCVNK